LNSNKFKKDVDKYGNDMFLALTDETPQEWPTLDDCKSFMSHYEKTILVPLRELLPEKEFFMVVHQYRHMSSRILTRVSLLERKIETQ
jgi:hypothetical protein